MKLLALVAFLVLLGLVYSQTCSSNVNQCLQITCGINTPTITVNNTGCRPCGPSDVMARFTTCQQNTKSLIYYWRPPATCVSPLGAANSVLPAPVSGFPCNFGCSAGQYIDVNSMSCQQCSPGSYVNNFEIVTQNWQTTPPQFRTYCKADNSRYCESWNFKGDYVESGRVAGLTNVRSYLEYSVELSQPGAYIYFEYAQVCDDPTEGIEFIVNDEVAASNLITNATTLDVYQNFTLQLDPGFYTFVWYIHKENQYYLTNTARIRKIQVGGVANALTQCLQCQPGEYSDGTQACMPCPDNTYSTSAGSSSCTACPQWTTSTKGSTSCTPDPFAACVASDWYLKDLTACLPADDGSNTKTVQWQLVSPQLCDPSNPSSVTQPTGTQQVSCTRPVCDVGTYYDIPSFQCKYCPKGTYVNTTAGGPCAPCASGSGTENSYYIKAFWPGTASDVLSTTCFGSGCKSKGWRMHGSYIDSGYGNGWSRSVLWLTATVQHTPSITISYSISCPQGTGALYFGFGAGRFGTSVPCPGSSSTAPMQNITLDLSPYVQTNGQVVFGVIYASNVDAYSPYDSYVAKIYSIVLKGTALGGSDQCTTCKPGTYAGGDANCDPCPPGTFSTGGAASCTGCPANTFSVGGATQCTACGAGTLSSTNSSTCYYANGPCIYNGTIGTIARNYNFINTANTLKGLSFNSNNSTGRFFLNLLHDPLNPHQYCGNSIACFQQGNFFGPATSIGDTFAISTYLTLTKSGLRISAQSLNANCPAPNMPGNSTYYSTTIDLTCNPNIATPSVSISKLSSDPNGCTYYMEVQSTDACPSCTDGDYLYYKGECINGTQNIQYIRKVDPARLCYGGFQQNLTASQQSCNVLTQTVETPMWGLIVAGIIAIIILIAIIVAMVVAFVLFVKNRQLSYQLLHRPGPQGGEL